MDPKSDEGIFLGYSTNSRAYRVFNSRTKVVMKSINLVIDNSTKEVGVPDDVGAFFPMNNNVLEDITDSSINIVPEDVAYSSVNS